MKKVAEAASGAAARLPALTRSSSKEEVKSALERAKRALYEYLAGVRQSLPEGYEATEIPRIKALASDFFDDLVRTGIIVGEFPTVSPKDPAIKALMNRPRVQSIRVRDIDMSTFPRAVEENFRRGYGTLEDFEREAGDKWYPLANKIAERIARDTGLTLEQASGIIAALSPRNRWSSNVQQARMVPEMLRQGIMPVAFGPTGRATVEKAYLIGHGQVPVTDILSGPKVSAFHPGILYAGRSDLARVPTIDAIMASAGTGLPVEGIPNSLYPVYAEALVNAATKEGVPHNPFQAGLWAAHRRFPLWARDPGIRPLVNKR